MDRRGGMARIASLVVWAVWASPTFGGVLYVSSDFNHEVLRYDDVSGAYLDTFISAGSGGLAEPHGILERCTDLLVASFGTDQILRFDLLSGVFIDVFVDSTTGLDNPVTLRYGPDDRIYIASQGSDEILRCNRDGSSLAAFISAGSGGLDGPSGFAFAPDGRLYVAGRFSANVIAYDASTGAFIEVIADSGDGLASGTTFGATLGDNGDLYFASNNTVYRYDLESDSIVATIPIAFPIGLETGGSGGVFVATGNNLRRINTTDNSVSGPLLTGGSINVLNFFRFPDPNGVPGCAPAGIPTATEWGVVVLGLGLVVAGTICVLRSSRRSSPT